MEKDAKFKDCGLAYLLCFIFVLCVSLVVAGLIAFVATNEGSTVSEVSGRDSFVCLNAFLSEIIFILIFFIIVLINKNNNFVSSYRIKFKFDLKIFLGVVALSVVTMLCSLNLTNCVNLGFSYISPIPLTNTVNMSLGNFWQFVLGVLFLAVIPSICEELVFRGIIYNGLRKRFSYKIAILLSAIMFMIMHLSIYKSFYQIILGLILGGLVFCTGTIFYGIIFHFVNNFTIVFLSYALKGNNILEFSNFGLGEIFISILIFAVGVGVVCLFFRWLKNYTLDKRENFELEVTSKALDYVYSVEDKNLSYEQKIMFNDRKDEGLLLFVLSGVFAIILWSFNSFGGFV